MLAGHAARQFYSTVNIETIPLQVGAKIPLAESWPTKPTADQWRNAPRDCNVGIRHCGDVINIECDDRKIAGTFDHVVAGLNGLGITNPPIVRSASRIGRHVYVRCNDAPRDVAYRNLSRDVGSGELRIGIGAMSVLPDSQINGATYEKIAGDWQAIPVVQWPDLSWLLPMQRVITHHDALPLPLTLRPMPRGLIDLFDKTARAGRGESIGKYPSRSEVEAAIVASLILNGWNFDLIRAEFKRRNVGHYHDAKRHADHYLQTTYANALAAIMSSPIRQALAIDYQAADWRAWPGKTGNGDRATYLAVLSECYRADAIKTSVSVREISEYAAIAIGTAQASLHRLAECNLIERTRGATEDGTLAAMWKLTGENRTSVTVKYPVQESPPPKVTSVQISPPTELASRQALGPSAVAVYQHLDIERAKSITQLSRDTGRARSTVRAALDRLSDYHLAAQTDSGGWLAGTNDLESVADQFDCTGLAEARRVRHDDQRIKYRAYVKARREKSQRK